MASRVDNSVKEELAKSKNSLHPKSRKCVAMVKKIKKESKKEKAKQDNRIKQSLLAEKLLWFQKNMELNICPYNVEATTALVERYMARNDKELEQIQIKRSIGENRNRQHIGREDAICMTKQRETSDYQSCGLEIPNILNSSQCSTLRKWDGNLNFIPNFKFCRFGKRHIDENLKKRQKSIHKKNKLDLNIYKNEVVQELQNNNDKFKKQNNHVLILKNKEAMDFE